MFSALTALWQSIYFSLNPTFGMANFSFTRRQLNLKLKFVQIKWIGGFLSFSPLSLFAGMQSRTPLTTVCLVVSNGNSDSVQILLTLSSDIKMSELLIRAVLWFDEKTGNEEVGVVSWLWWRRCLFRNNSKSWSFGGFLSKRRLLRFYCYEFDWFNPDREMQTDF